MSEIFPQTLALQVLPVESGSRLLKRLLKKKMFKNTLQIRSDYGIGVNAVAPSGVDTNMMRSIETNAAPGEESSARKNFEASVPLKRYAEASEIADLMVFLASDKASFITGSYYRIDGRQGATSV